MDKLIIAISGASGSIYGIRLLEALRKLNAETIFIVSQAAQDIIKHETSYTLDDVVKLATVYYEEEDLFAPIASGSICYLHSITLWHNLS
jgi:4-hydroxy-3-polyprenylbenzoate decarboxylase